MNTDPTAKEALTQLDKIESKLRDELRSSLWMSVIFFLISVSLGFLLAFLEDDAGIIVVFVFFCCFVVMLIANIADIPGLFKNAKLQRKQIIIDAAEKIEPKRSQIISNAIEEAQQIRREADKNKLKAEEEAQQIEREAIQKAIVIEHEADKSKLEAEEKVKHSRIEAERIMNKADTQWNKMENFKKNALKEISDIFDGKIKYGYLADLIADHKELINDRYAYEFEHKSRPAYKTAEKLRAVSRELRNTEKKYKKLSYQLAIYENVFPWLADFKEFSKEDLEQISHGTDDEQDEKTRLKNWLSPTEYDNLPNVEKYQLALNRWQAAPKTNWQIGIMYERYIGYLYEMKGFSVSYFGAIKGLEDLGRDLIAKKNDKIIVIQCKYWKKEKTIHEKHIFQLYGTMFALALDNEKQKISGLFITSATLSDTAKLYAEKLGIKYKELAEFNKNYPCIKCNISKLDQQKIYHLPFDQQYDNIKIEPSKGEFYVSTVAEAENLGFRRAYKWHGN